MISPSLLPVFLCDYSLLLLNHWPAASHFGGIIVVGNCIQTQWSKTLLSKHENTRSKHNSVKISLATSHRWLLKYSGIKPLVHKVYSTSRNGTQILQIPIQFINHRITEHMMLMFASIREAEAAFHAVSTTFHGMTYSAERYSDKLDWTTAALPQKQATEQAQALLPIGSTHQRCEAMPNENVFKMQAICWGQNLHNFKTSLTLESFCINRFQHSEYR